MDGGLVRWKLCSRSSGALGVFSPCEHERRLRAARQRIAVFYWENVYFFTTDLSLVSCRHTSALVARCADFSLASHMPCWSSCHERVILVVALRDVANEDVFYVFSYNSEAPCASGTPVLVSGGHSPSPVL